MKVSTILPAVVSLLIFFNVARVECIWSRYQTMFVFGDSFADTGNVPKSDLSQDTRQWYYPYGSSHPSGRLSNGWVQTDFVASLLGLQEAPPVYRLRQDGYGGGSSGVNFAVTGAGVYEVPQKVPTLRKQVDQFQKMIEEGTINEWSLELSVALVAISGSDYAALISSNDTLNLVGKVTTEIAEQVKRLQDLGVPKILVNNLHPLGCAPSQSRPSNYTRCDDRANTITSTHNKNLKEKLATGNGNGDVMLLDLYSAFLRIVLPGPAHNQAEETLGKTVKIKLRPACESLDPKGYCGQKDENGNSKYSVLDLDEEPFAYCFYWDDAHPTHTGWFLVMMQLQEDIKAFLDI